MTILQIDSINAPSDIKDHLKMLSSDISFTHQGKKGANGYIFFGCNNILNTQVAVKFYYWGGKKEYHAEPSTLANIHSPHILDVYSAGLTNDDWAYFVTPFCKNGDMDDAIQKTDIGNMKAIDLTCQSLSGVVALHEKRLVHRDLKPENIYIGDNNQSIIGDFGSIKHIPEKLDYINASSHAIIYRPPESIESEIYGFCGDIYQCGIILYQLLGGYLPYDEISWLNQKERRQYAQLTTDADKSIFVDQCLKPKIVKGKILDISSLPPWVPEKLRRTIRKATNTNANN